MKLTPWFSGDQKPVRPGVYIRHYGEHDGDWWFSRWDGGHWFSRSFTAKAAEQAQNISRKRLPWRGILRNGK